MRIYYHSEGVTDLAVMRDGATFRQSENRYGPPESSLIHLHPKEGVECNVNNGNDIIKNPEMALTHLWFQANFPKPDPILTQELSEVVHVDPDSGILTWNDKDHDGTGA